MVRVLFVEYQEPSSTVKFLMYSFALRREKQPGLDNVRADGGGMVEQEADASVIDKKWGAAKERTMAIVGIDVSVGFELVNPQSN